MPEDCPTPEYHRTHRYCPSCTWTEAEDKPRCPAVNRHEGSGDLGHQCESYEGHHGDHHVVWLHRVPKTTISWANDA